MYELIVLGLIPGTQMRITFTAWLTIASLIISIIIVRKVYRSQAIRETIVAYSFYHTVRTAREVTIQ